MKRHYLALLAIAVFALGNTLSLSAAAKNDPDLRPVPGMVINHDGLIINPSPVSMERSDSEMLDFSKGFMPIFVDDNYLEDIKSLPLDYSGAILNIIADKELAAEMDVKSYPGAYRLIVKPEKVTIIGFDEEGGFNGLQTLLQAIKSRKLTGSTMLPSLDINDYPAMKYRGVVEGFYGNPWSHKSRLSILDFMGANKLNHYVYGPKDDPYHRAPYWRKPYPEKEGKLLAELAERARKNRIKFVWAIHPGGDIRWNKEDYDSLLNKLNSVYALGVRNFAVFFDDIEGNGANSSRQATLLNRINKDFVKVKGDVGNLIVCPTDYNQGWANPKEDGQLAVYGRELDKDIEVYWTGKYVCCDIEQAAQEFVNSRIKRPALVWWNFPVTDYCRSNLMLGPVYGLDQSFTDKDLVGIDTNPMEQGEASKSAMYGVADWAWNPSKYNAIDNWTRSLAEMMPGAPEAYGVFAIHSCDPPKNYRRNESWNIETFKYNNYTPAQFDILKKEFEKISKIADVLAEKGGNPELYAEIAPWLVEFTYLGQRGLKALELIKIYESGDKDKFRKAYNELSKLNLIQKKSYLAHRSGTLKLQPFIDQTLADLGEKLN